MENKENFGTLIKKVKVGSIHYGVYLVPYVQINGDRNYQGSCSYHDARIEVMEGLTLDRFNEVLMHELTHAAIHEAGLELDNEEDIVVRLSKILHGMLDVNDTVIGLEEGCACIDCIMEEQEEEQEEKQEGEKDNEE